MEGVQLRTVPRICGVAVALGHRHVGYKGTYVTLPPSRGGTLNKGSPASSDDSHLKGQALPHKKAQSQYWFFVLFF
jgi:hypothetical protein